MEQQHVCTMSVLVFVIPGQIQSALRCLRLISWMTVIQTVMMTVTTIILIVCAQTLMITLVKMIIMTSCVYFWQDICQLLMLAYVATCSFEPQFPSLGPTALYQAIELGLPGFCNNSFPSPRPTCCQG